MEDPGCGSIGKIETRSERLKRKSLELGGRHERKLKKFSENFNEIFGFFLNSYRKGILTFCGSKVEVLNNSKEICGKEGFRRYEDGNYKYKTPTTRHSNILKGVIIGKKSWGLFLQQWTDGIVDWCFTKEEILNEFTTKGIKIPESLLKDFDNVLEKKKQIRNEKYLNQLKHESTT